MEESSNVIAINVSLCLEIQAMGIKNDN